MMVSLQFDLQQGNWTRPENINDSYAVHCIPTGYLQQIRMYCIAEFRHSNIMTNYWFIILLWDIWLWLQAAFSATSSRRI